MKITALVDNTRLKNRTDLTVERGLSLHISAMGREILFDAGSSDAFCNNATLLGINIQDVDAAVISHRHHDHCNGVTHFIDRNAKGRVYFRECQERAHYFKAFGIKRDIGIDKKVLSHDPDRMTFISNNTEIFPNIFVITQLSEKYERPHGNKYIFTKTGHDCVHDSFDHELLLVIKEEDGMTVFTGCAHRGVLNMVETAKNIFPNIKIKAVVGGFHLVGLPLLNRIGGSEKDIALIGEKLLSYQVDKLYTGHCTGKKAYGILKRVLGDRLEHLPTGRSVVI